MPEMLLISDWHEEPATIFCSPISAERAHGALLSLSAM